MRKEKAGSEKRSRIREVERYRNEKWKGEISRSKIRAGERYVSDTGRSEGYGRNEMYGRKACKIEIHENEGYRSEMYRSSMHESEGYGNEMHGSTKKEKEEAKAIRTGTVQQVLSVLAKRLAELLYPPRCILCDRVVRTADEGCCADCRAALPYITGARCMKCGKPVEEEEEYCSDCRKYPHFFDRGAAAFTYTGRMRQSVYRMKKANRRDYIPFYAREMEKTLALYLDDWHPEVILPVPMHPQKKRARGYNQAELLAREIGRLTEIAIDTASLSCVKKTPSQKQLGRRERMKNLKGSFLLKEDFCAVHSALVVDDVYTTGSTVDEISRILKAAGVSRVFFLVLCTGKGKRR